MRNNEQRAAFVTRKKLIQQILWENMDLIVDKQKSEATAVLMTGIRHAELSKIQLSLPNILVLTVNYFVT